MGSVNVPGGKVDAALSGASGQGLTGSLGTDLSGSMGSFSGGVTVGPNGNVNGNAMGSVNVPGGTVDASLSGASGQGLTGSFGTDLSGSAGSLTAGVTVGPGGSFSGSGSGSVNLPGGGSLSGSVSSNGQGSIGANIGGVNLNVGLGGGSGYRLRFRITGWFRNEYRIGKRVRVWYTSVNADVSTNVNRRTKRLETTDAKHGSNQRCINNSEAVPKDEKPEYNWTDVTEEFVAASRDLHLGELYHDSMFGLFEAMSAIEMMDPKMDAGMLCNQIQRKVLNFEQAVEAGDVKINNLSHSELIGVMDASMACLVTWLEGHSLAQTVFTNLYLHNPYVIEDRSLKAFSICMLKIVDHIRDRVNRAGVFEEEDFQSMTYGFKMADQVTDIRATGMLKEVEDDMNRILKITRSKPGEDRDQQTEIEHEQTNAVYCRLKFYRLFFTMLLAFNKEKCEGIEQAQKLILQLLDLLPVINNTVHMGIVPDDKEVGKNDYPTIMGFEPLVNQRLLPPTFPRYTVIRSRGEALYHIEGLLHRLQMVTTVPQMTSFQTILEAFKEFSKYSPCVLSRSILQLTFLPQNKRVFGKTSMVDFLKDAARGFAAPPVLYQKSPLYNNAQIKGYVDAWFMQAVRPFSNLIHITGHNRARQRDKWGQVLEEMSTLQEEGDKVDAYIHGILIKQEPSRSHMACLSGWVLYHTIQAMIQYVLAGFELELYADFEYHYIYWYLYEMLYPWLINALHRADNFLLDHETMADNQQKGRSNKKNRKKKRTRTLNKEITLAQAEQSMFGGYYKAVTGFRLDGKMKPPNFRFDKEDVRYTHRFHPFTSVSTPPCVQYLQYKDMSDMNRYEAEASALNLYAASCKCFQQAKQIYESMIVHTDEANSKELNALLKVAKTNLIVMRLLMDGHKKESDVSCYCGIACYSRTLPSATMDVFYIIMHLSSPTTLKTRPSIAIFCLKMMISMLFETMIIRNFGDRSSDLHNGKKYTFPISF
ncbi:hypothetical protein FSP39_007523 [Pinctada imbricata]|uniref:Protein MAK10 homolog n=1 Tax=Pinctada imbricata TaxID=66713 RepID=A0AA89BZ06_PINIB|nr:hypothetical protein FSP39_007523 [Pinctada imbricata]